MKTLLLLKVLLAAEAWTLVPPVPSRMGSLRMTTTDSPKSLVDGGIKLQHEPVYLFGRGRSAMGTNSKSLLGGKGANLADMSALGLSVPPGFTITTEICALYNKQGKSISPELWENILNNIDALEEDTGKKLGDPKRPLLVSVRSGAAISMPGMMDTVLNLGLNDDTVQGLAAGGNDRFAYDCYRRFLHMFGDVVLGIPHHAFEAAIHSLKTTVGAASDSDLTADNLRQLVDVYKGVYIQHNKEFPSDPKVQLQAAISAVFDSWMSERAIKYREAEGVTGLLGTAVNVQAMCFGNLGPSSGTGVCFTRNPNTGGAELYGEYLENAQGEDVVAGIRTPVPIARLQQMQPEVYKELIRNVNLLESNFHDMQDIEFTVEDGNLFMLQTRSGKRVGQAAIKIAVDFKEQGLATVDQAILSVKPEHLNQLLHPQFIDVNADSYKDNVVTKGLPASPGAAVGKIVFTPEAAEACHVSKQKCILVRDETSPEDVGGMWASEGVLTARGGMTSHAAVVARGWGKPCVCGTADLEVDLEKRVIRFRKTDVGHRDADYNRKEIVLREGDYISLNGDTGEVLVGQQTLKPPSVDQSQDVKKFMSWVDRRRKVRVLANADSPKDATEARKNGAEGIGLVRTEHMFFQEDRINVVRRMILARDAKQRQQALDELLVFQRADFEGILSAMDGLPVTVRLLDPPLHEFLPSAESVDWVFAMSLGMTIAECQTAINKLSEVNPMLGLRGCRLGVVIPELIEMQARAMVEAALNNKFVKNMDPHLEIMIPLVGSAAEFSHQEKIIRRVAAQVFEEYGGSTIDVKVGTMIEVPRAALTAYDIAKAGAEFFSYGTNDLTQMTYGFSRDDVGSYLPTYLKQGILERDPFDTIDEKGVGQLINLSAAAGRQYALESGNTKFKAGVCGEHGGDPTSVKFFARCGLDYVSCSPFRVPLARLAAAQAAIEQEKK